MEKFRSLDDVQDYVLEHGRADLEARLRGSEIFGGENRAWAQGWLDRDDALNSGLISAVAELRRELELQSKFGDEEAVTAPAEVRTVSRSERFANWAVVLAVFCLLAALAAVYFKFFWRHG